MKRTNALALCFAAALMWSCNDATTRPETASIDPRIPNTINSVTEYAAITAGYQLTSKVAAMPETTDVDEGFGPDMFKAFTDAGICRNFVLLLEELMSNIENGGQSVDPFAASPRLRRVGQCMDEKTRSFSLGVQPTDGQILSLINDCFCDGSGSLFGDFAVSTYAPPDFNGFAPPSMSEANYESPTIPGYSRPAFPGYAPPKL